MKQALSLVLFITSNNALHTTLSAVLSFTQPLSSAPPWITAAEFPQILSRHSRFVVLCLLAFLNGWSPIIEDPMNSSYHKWRVEKWASSTLFKTPKLVTSSHYEQSTGTDVATASLSQYQSMDLDHHRPPMKTDVDIAINSVASLGLLWPVHLHVGAFWQHCLIRAWMAQYHPPFVITTSMLDPL